MSGLRLEFRRVNGHNRYFCPMCPEKGVMFGAGMWNHLRGPMHRYDHVEATEYMEFVRTRDTEKNDG